MRFCSLIIMITLYHTRGITLTDVIIALQDEATYPDIFKQLEEALVHGPVSESYLAIREVSASCGLRGEIQKAPPA